MEHRTLEITLISAKGLNKVNLISKMDVYALVSISGGYKDVKQKTPVDKDGDTNPTWNFPMKFTVDEAAVQQNRLTLVIKLKAEGMLGDKEIGAVNVPVKELIDGAGGSKPTQFVSYQVRKPSGKPKGELSFSYRFGEKGAGAAAVAKADEPVTAYPVVGSSSAYPPPYETAAKPYEAAAKPYEAGAYPPAAGAYPPPPGGNYYPPQAGYPPPPQVAYNQQQPSYAGYPPPPPPGYGGYPPAPGYGYPPPPVQQQPPKKNKFGMGLGAGLLGGALGGLLIGDIVSDAAGCGGGGCGGGF